MKRERGCLSSLPATTRELLALRAGLDGAPQSRAAAADQLGIPRHRAAQLEHSGLRALHVACGGRASGADGGAAADPHTLALVGNAPPLQPVAYLRASSDAPSAVSQNAGGEADTSDGSSAPESDTSGTHPFTGGDNPRVPAAAVASDETGSPALTVLMACLLAALAALMLMALRHRMRNRPVAQGTVTQASALAAPAAPARQVEPEPEPEPVEPEPLPVEPQQAREEPKPIATAPALPSPAESTPQPSARDPQPTQARDRNLSRSAGVVASGIVSFAVRELVKRRRGRRR